jgi:hypothetical protein
MANAKSDVQINQNIHGISELPHICLGTEVAFTQTSKFTTLHREEACFHARYLRLILLQVR